MKEVPKLPSRAAGDAHLAVRILYVRLAQSRSHTDNHKGGSGADSDGVGPEPYSFSLLNVAPE